jgi:hypothetical protein
MSIYRGLVGTVQQFAGTAGTVTLSPGSFVTHIVCHATAGSASVQILGATAIPIISGAPPTSLMFLDDAMQAP